MSKIKLILPACFIAFFACSCSEKVTGTTEDENTVIAQGESSSSEVVGEPEPGEPESSSSASKTPNNPETIEQHIYAIIDTNTRDILIGGEYGGIGGIGCGGIGGIDTATTSTTLNLITLDSVLAGRIEVLTQGGLSKDAADTTAKWELLSTIGVDSILREHPGVNTKFIDYALDYIFGGTTKSEFFKEVAETFARTGTLEKKHYCNFSDLFQFRKNDVSTIYSASAFPNYILYDNTAYTPKGCAGGFSRPVPKFIVNNVARKCFDIPYCTTDLKDSIRIGEYMTDSIGIGNIRFICRKTGWDIPTDKEVYTYNQPCNREGKYILYGGKPISKSFVCSLDSGWYEAETIDAETFDVPCDKHGKLYTSPNNPAKTYVCRKEHFCRSYDFYNADAPCMDEGWDYANQNDIEMSKTECTTDGQTQQSENDPNMYYVCQDGRWSEFYNRPCDTDNQRIKIVNEKVWTNFTEYICYNKTWRPTYEWHTEYPAEYYFNPEIDYGSFTDPRDNYVYHTIEYKGRTWIAENMKYAGFTESELAKETRCLDDSCKNIGRYYSVNVAGKVCPEGWNLPDSSDILTLGTRQPETPHNISQLGGTGSSYSAPDTYGLSFILSGRIIDTDQPYSPWQGYTALLWINETNEKGERLIADISYYEIEFWGYYTNPQTYRNTYPDTDPTAFTDQTFLAVRCVKK